MRNKIFDDIYNQKVDLSFKDLSRDTSLKSKDFKKIVTEDYPPESIENILETARNNPYKKFSEDEANIINKELQKNIKEAKELISEIKKRKEDIYDEVSNSENKFTLKIENNASLLEAANNVFGGNKNTISYEDYVTLLEMKKQIQFNETRDLMNEVFDDF